MATQTIYSSVPIDIAQALGTNLAYVGFTSGTGAGWENHDILSWQFADTTQPAPPPPIPEPAAASLMVPGAALLAGFAARRRT
jgi:hypothetical protein